MRPIVLATHSVFTSPTTDTHGPAHSVAEYLSFHKIPYVFVKHPIVGIGATRIERYGSLPVTPTQFWPFFGIHSFAELVTNMRVCFALRSEKPIYIGVDPLNALSGVLGKYLRWVSTIVYYTPDYTTQRFKNALVNYVYHAIDRFVALRADQVWCVSQAIMQIRKQQSVRLGNIYHVPNSPSLRVTGHIRDDTKHPQQLVMVGNIVPTMDYTFMIDAVDHLRRTYPKLRLEIVGEGAYMNALRQQVAHRKLTQTIHFLGQLSHTDVINLLKTSGVGIALYTGMHETNYFGDSMKIREYLACGLPVVTTDVVETARVVDTYHAGEIIKIRKDTLYPALKKILDTKNYNRYVKNALRAAKVFDFDTMIAVPFRKLV